VNIINCKHRIIGSIVVKTNVGRPRDGVKGSESYTNFSLANVYTITGTDIPLLTSGGLSDGEIAAIVVCSVVGGAAVVGGSSYIVLQWRRER